MNGLLVMADERVMPFFPSQLGWMSKRLHRELTRRLRAPHWAITHYKRGRRRGGKREILLASDGKIKSQKREAVCFHEMSSLTR